ncbi:1-acyl-sn-glycerol-3-phosphate acyltransferase [Pseudomonas petroselini]|uniref:1-acyl-sn-glycerol-3-phosphate acyltransferase n=1 Tax=Pseudomonas petroselini TaxID=2899822 RepID=UPI001F92562A|nr:hypothetical protein [Pseudomonas marginalis]
MNNKVPPLDPLHSIAGLCTRKTWAFPSVLRQLYLPFGCVLACVRLVSMIAVSLIAWPLPVGAKRILYRGLLWILGIRIKCALSPRQISTLTSGCVVAANHVSVIDPFAILAMPGATLVASSGYNRVVAFTALLLIKCAGGHFWNGADKKTFSRNLQKMRTNPQGTALYTTPEATINNGHGLYRFRAGLLSRQLPVVPLAGRLILPFGLVASPLHASALASFLRLLMMPWMVCEMTYLERLEREEHQSGQAFADQIQARIAQHLGIAATHWTREDKHRYRQIDAQARR